ncbi:MAG: SufE family protein [Chloroflexi bacterium]|nr:SufE family protein [Chloroflexota bacterium]
MREPSARPEALNALIGTLDFAEDRNQRIQMLIDIAERYQPPPSTLASRPYPESHKVPACESEAFVWSQARPDGRLDFYIAVENPQGISAKAMAVTLVECLSGAPLPAVLAVTPEIVAELFGPELSIGKSMGLEAMVGMVRQMARHQHESSAE